MISPRKPWHESRDGRAATANRWPSPGAVRRLVRGVLAAILIAAVQPAAPADEPLRIIVADETEWGGAVAEDVRRVLRSAGTALLAPVPDAALPPLEVRARGGPIVLHERADGGMVRIRLNTGGNLWAQYAYQFSHELCHVLCRYDRDPTGHQWFEESLCELASLFVLRRTAETWADEPPYPNWRGYAVHLGEYADQRIAAARLPEGTSLADWFRANRADLATAATDRARNTVVAAALLPLFESCPRHWAAVPHLNDASPTAPQPFRDHLAEWRRRLPPDRRDTVDAIAAAFGETLPADDRDAPPAAGPPSPPRDGAARSAAPAAR